MAGKNTYGAGSSSKIPIPDDCDPAYAMYLTEMDKIETRGPGYHGFELFDSACVFANLMKLNFNQRIQLNSIAEISGSKYTKEYVFKLTKSSVIPKKCKIEFSQSFTNEFLLGFFICEPVEVVVNCSYSNNEVYVWMILVSSGKATITSGLTEAVKEYNLKEGDICSFSFTDGRKFSSPKDESAFVRLEIK